MTVRPPKSAVYITSCPFAAGGPARAFAITEQQRESVTQIVPQPENLAKLVTAEEWAAMRSQVVTSSATHAPNSSQVVMSSRKNRGIAYRPYAFTEQGIAMLSSVLRSQRAVEVNIAIMRTFVQLRRLMESNRDLARRIEALETRYDEQFSQVFDAIKQLISEDKTRKSKRPIGFL